MHFSGDIMGVSNRLIEEKIGGHALFINADAGLRARKIASFQSAFRRRHRPCRWHVWQQTHNGWQCENGQRCDWRHRHNDANYQRSIESVHTRCWLWTNQFKRHTGSIRQLHARWTVGYLHHLSRYAAICFVNSIKLQPVLGCDANVHMPSSWLTNAPRFTAIEMLVNNDKNIVVTMPGEGKTIFLANLFFSGEPLLQLGWWVRNDTLNAGYTGTTLLAGYAQAHMGVRSNIEIVW